MYILDIGQLSCVVQFQEGLIQEYRRNKNNRLLLTNNLTGNRIDFFPQIIYT